MITELSELTMAQYIKLANGDASVLLRKNEVVSPAKLTKGARKINFEFRRISDAAGASAYISKYSEIVKLKCEEELLLICDILCSLNGVTQATELMKECGVNVEGKLPDQISREIKSELSLCRRKINHIDHEMAGNVSARDCKIDFDAITANLMTHFKFQIDVSTISASIYAHLIAQMGNEIKATAKAIARLKART